MGEQAAFLKGIAQFVEEQRRLWKVPGLAIAVVKDNELVFAEGFGRRDEAKGLETRANTLFSIASLTKSFTTAAVAMLVDEGLVEWDRPVRSYLPEFRLFDSYASERATLRDLACHRTGLPRYDLATLNPAFSREDIVCNLAHLEPNEEFRTTFQYQNMMYTTLGYLVGRVAGCTWEEFVRQRLLTPLGMRDTIFSLDKMQEGENYSLAYHERKAAVEAAPWILDDANGPAGSIISSVRDMAKWLLFQLNQGRAEGKELLPAALVRELHTPHMVTPQRSQYRERNQVNSYGLGWYISSYRGSKMIYHSGNIIGQTALMTLLPEENAGVIVLSNLHETQLTSIVTYNVLDRLLGLEEIDWSGRLIAARGQEEQGEEQKLVYPRIEGTMPSHALSDYAGEFAHPGMGRLRLEVVDGRLQGTYGLITLGFNHHHYDTFTVDIDLFGQVITRLASFHTDQQGAVRQVALPLGLQPGVKDIVFTRVAAHESLPKEALESYCGEYELGGMLITVATRTDGTLVMTVPGQGNFDMVAVSATRFEFAKMPGYAVEFKLEGEAVKELLLHQPNGVFPVPRKR